jgi:hypothetical protein
MKVGDQTVLSMPRTEVIRTMILSHMIHHRAQLGVYLGSTTCRCRSATVRARTRWTWRRRLDGADIRGLARISHRRRPRGAVGRVLARKRRRSDRSCASCTVRIGSVALTQSRARHTVP